MNKPTFIVIPVDYENAKEIALQIEGRKYKTTTALRIQLARDLTVPEGDDTDGIEDIGIYDLSEFTQALNDDTFGINVDASIISYVYFE